MKRNVVRIYKGKSFVSLIEHYTNRKDDIMELYRMKLNVQNEVENIITAHTNSVMYCGEFKPESESDSLRLMEIWEFTLYECARILTKRLIAGTYTPMEYNEIRDALAKTINGIFAPYAK